VEVEVFGECLRVFVGGECRGVGLLARLPFSLLEEAWTSLVLDWPTREGGHKRDTVRPPESKSSAKSSGSISWPQSFVIFQHPARQVSLGLGGAQLVARPAAAQLVHCPSWVVRPLLLLLILLLGQ